MLQYEKQVREIISEVLQRNNCNDISIKEDLQYIGMDSLNCIKVIVVLEQYFNIIVPDEKLGMKYVRNIFDICNLVEECKNN